jgi:hypothetical protein
MGRDVRGFQVRIASPCSVEWSSMTGTARVRFCGLCQKNVYELSGLTRDEVLALLAAKPDVCVSFFQRDDGTVLTADCAVGARLARRARRAAWMTRSLVVGLTSAALGLVASALPGRSHEQDLSFAEAERLLARERATAANDADARESARARNTAAYDAHNRAYARGRAVRLLAEHGLSGGIDAVGRSGVLGGAGFTVVAPHP